MKIGFIGLSHLGLVSSLACSTFNNKVICYDKNLKHILELQKGVFNIDEPHLNTIYKNNNKNIFFTNNFKKINDCDIVYLSIDIKTRSNGASDLREVKELIKIINYELSKKIILVILCQVPPSFTRNINWPKKNLYYQVETLIFGNAFERALKPERIIVGAERKNNVNKKYLSYLNKFKCPLLFMNYESAELAKISINLFLIAQVTTTNSIAELANKINADWVDVKKSLFLDRRIGKYSYLNPGLGISGGNLERDLKSMIDLSNRYKTNSKLFKSFKQLSEYNKKWLPKKLLFLINKHPVNKINIGILGLTYKKNTHSIKNSPSIMFINANKDKNFLVYDPSMPSYTAKNVKIVQSYNEVLENSNVLLIMNDWDEYREITLSNLNKLRYPKIIIDPFSMFLHLNLNKKKFVYESLQ